MYKQFCTQQVQVRTQIFEGTAVFRRRFGARSLTQRRVIRANWQLRKINVSAARDAWGLRWGRRVYTQVRTGYRECVWVNSLVPGTRNSKKLGLSDGILEFLLGRWRDSSKYTFFFGNTSKSAMER